MDEAEPFPLVSAPPVHNPSAHPEKCTGDSRALRRELVGFGMVSVVSLGIGLLINGWRAHPLPLGYAPPKERLAQVVARISVATPAKPTQSLAPRAWRKMGLDEFQELVMARRGLVIDARPSTFYQAGHVPGALSLPREDFEKSYATLRSLLERDRAKPIVIYCSEADCKDSELVAEALGRLGYPHLSIYKEGWEEWSRAGLPQEAGQKP